MASIGGRQAECDHCGTIFDMQRWTDGATYCSTRCRVAAHRKREKMAQRLRDFQIEAVALIREMKDGEYDGIKNALERVSKTIYVWTDDPTPPKEVKVLALDRNPFLYDIIAGSATD